MVRLRWALFAALAIAQAGCASHRDTYAGAALPRPNWACRNLDTAKRNDGQPAAGRIALADRSGFSAERQDAGAVLGALVVWPVLAGICLASRS